MARMLLLNKEVQGLIELISNTTEAYTTALFLAPKPGESLQLVAHHSLSQNINPDVRIGPGEGLVGWVLKNNKSVNVDKFDLDTRRLLFYRTDESIKSFIAVPLPGINGVLAVDSKQRYVFTDKSQKILHQFGQVLEMTLKRLRTINEGQRRKEAMKFLSDLEGALYKRDQSGEHLRQAAALLRKYVGADACFLASILPEDRTQYQLITHDAYRSYPLHKNLFKANQGLMGWVMREKKPLNLKRIPLGTNKSYIFYPEEPFKDFTAFAGLPLIWGRRLLGAVCLSAREPFNIDETKAQALEMSADRLAASLELELLLGRISDFSRLDSQTGLPHRSEFCHCVARMLKSTSTPLALIIIRLENLEAVSLNLGQEAAEMTLKKAAEHLLAQTEEDIELGHLTYGTFGVALLNRSEAEVNQIRSNLIETLEKQTAESSQGHASLQIKAVTAPYPSPTLRAEDLIHQTLALLQEPETSPSSNGA
ncbi:MAG: GAF domain-containing protein [Deltaproteobacteria bacterium]|nr:GAF domain-containing protein [Deltaproteobacteria bacterium]